MPPKISAEVYYKVLAFLGLKLSFSVIIKELKKENLTISPGMISKIKSEKENPNKAVKVDKRGRKYTLNEIQLNRLKRMTD